MKLQATKVFTKWLNNNISHFDSVERFDLLKLTEEQYTRYVDYRGVYEPYEYGDYDDSDGTIKVIQVEYLPECYAMPKYLGTKDLQMACKPYIKNGRIDIEDMITALCNEVCI